MGRDRLSTRFFSGTTVLACSLVLALAFLGTPGCGCGDDDFPPLTDSDCCCTFEWIHEQTAFPNATVNIVLVGANATLGATAVPAQLVNVNPMVPQVFQICVQRDHAIGASVTVEFREQNTNTLMGAGLLTYNAECIPTVQVLTPRTTLYSTDCGTPPNCCCNYRWRVPRAANGRTVEIVTLNVDASLAPVMVNPTVFPAVVLDTFLDFELCVDIGHAVGAQLTVRFQDQANAMDYGSYQLTYGLRCRPTIVPLNTAMPGLLVSPDCGPPCCCNFSWEVQAALVGVDITIATLNVNPTLMPTLMPTTATNVSQGNFVNFQVCVDPGHTIGAMMTIVITDTNSGAEYDRVVLTYNSLCTPTLFEDPAVPGAGIFAANCP